MGRNIKTQTCAYIIFQFPGEIKIYSRTHSDLELVSTLLPDTNVENQLLNILVGFLLIKIRLIDKKFTNFMEIFLLIASTESSVESSGEVSKNCRILPSIKF